MRKKITFTIIYFCIVSSLSAKGPLLAMLNDTLSNEVQKFGIANYTFECKPYGVVTLESLHKNSKVGSRCQKSIDKFYKKNPNLNHYSNSLLFYKQLYHIEIKNQECIIYAKGQVTLSELLMREGLAVKQTGFKDEEFSSYFTLAQRKAKSEKKGLWSTKIFTSCKEALSK